MTKKEPTPMPNVYLHCTPKGRLTGRYKFDHGDVATGLAGPIDREDALVPDVRHRTKESEVAGRTMVAAAARPRGIIDWRRSAGSVW